MSALLLDTCAAIWLANGDDMDTDAINQIDAAASREELAVSAITAWEVATLESKGRLAISMSPERWFEQLTSLHGLGLEELTPHILVRSTRLPGPAPRDPADRMIIATAREAGRTIVTRDKEILAYADAGHASALAC